MTGSRNETLKMADGTEVGLYEYVTVTCPNGHESKTMAAYLGVNTRSCPEEGCNARWIA